MTAEGRSCDSEIAELARIGAALVGRLREGPAEAEPLTLTETRAAKRLGVSPGFFKIYILPELRIIRRGSRVLVPVTELQNWIDRNATRTVER